MILEKEIEHGTKIILKIFLCLFFITISIAIFQQSNSDFIIAGGSEVLTDVYRTPFWSRILALSIFSFSIVFCFFHPKNFNKFLVNIIFVISLVIFTMSLHSLVYCGKKAAYTDVWAIFHFQKVEFDKAEGPHCQSCENYVVYKKTPFWLYLENKIGHKAYIFLGVPPWKIETKAFNWMENGIET